MAASSVVIKVKYGDMLRRFNAQIVEGELDVSIDGMRKKIHSLFSFAPDTELALTYIDEDNDVVALVDDEDLRDVVKQGLNPLRVTVKVNAEEIATEYSHSSGNSTPLRSPRAQEPLQALNSGVSELLGTVPEPLRGTLKKLSVDLASKASSSAPGVTELVDYFSRVGLSYLAQLSEFQPGVRPGTQGDVSESRTAAAETRDLGHFKVDSAASLEVPSNIRSELSSKNKESEKKLKPDATVEKNGVNMRIGIGGSKGESSFGLTTVAAGLDPQNIIVAQPGNDSLQNSGPVHPKSDVSHSVGKKGKKENVKKTIECYSNGKSHLTSHLPPAANAIGKIGESSITSPSLPSVANNIASGKAVNNPSAPILGPNPKNVGASDLMEGGYADDRMRSVLPDGFAKPPGLIGVAGSGISNFLGSSFFPTPMNECPFSSIPMGNPSAAPPHPTAEAVPFRRRNSQKDGSGNIFHHGVRCDGCGVHPITGPRLKSKVKMDYDLCIICFEEMGNSSDYIRIDRPVFNRHHIPLKGLHGARARDRGAVLPQVGGGFKLKPAAAKLDSRFIQDVNIIDGTVMAPLTPFTKIWRMRNNGTAVWPQKTQLVWIGGDKLSDELSVEVEIPQAGLLLDQELDVAVDFISPELPGRYISYWRLASPSGQKFGQRVWVLIEVEASVQEMQRESVRNLNLNLPPVNTGPEIISVDREPMVEDSNPEPGNSNKTVELVQPVVDMQQSNSEQELKFPINDSLLVGDGASSSLPSSAASPVSYPIIDLSDVPPALPFVPSLGMRNPLAPPLSAAPLASVAAPEPAVDLPEKKEVEEKLLRELEEMGFRQIDLNKEILRRNEYDLEQAVDHLCGVAEWDPMLDELEEMGFNDMEINRKLLKKNNGSIKRVVMDLIAGEKI